MKEGNYNSALYNVDIIESLIQMCPQMSSEQFIYVCVDCVRFVMFAW